MILESSIGVGCDHCLTLCSDQFVLFDESFVLKKCLSLVDDIHGVHQLFFVDVLLPCPCLHGSMKSVVIPRSRGLWDQRCQDTSLTLSSVFVSFRSTLRKFLTSSSPKTSLNPEAIARVVDLWSSLVFPVVGVELVLNSSALSRVSGTSGVLRRASICEDLWWLSKLILVKADCTLSIVGS